MNPKLTPRLRERYKKEIMPALQNPTPDMIFPALPGMTEGFTVLAIQPGRALTLGFRGPDGTVEVTWTFVLDEIAPAVTLPFVALCLSCRESS